MRLNGVWFPAIRSNSGADIFTLQMAKELSKRGIRAEIDWLPLRAEYAPWSVKPLRPPSWAEIAHINSWLPDCFIPPNLPVLATIHHATHETRLMRYKGLLRSGYHKYWISNQEKKTLIRSDAVVAVSHNTARGIANLSFCSNIDVIYNGVDLNTFLPSHRMYPKKPFRLIYVGPWKKLKGVEMFADIMRNLGPDFELCCIGESPRINSKKNFPKNIQFVGKIDKRERLVSELQSADAFLFPSRSEGLSLALIEAFACGLPAIVAACSSMPEVVEDNVSGVLCQPDEIGSFVTAVRALAINIEKWRAMRCASRERARDYFSIDFQVEKYMAKYMELLRIL